MTACPNKFESPESSSPTEVIVVAERHWKADTKGVTPLQTAQKAVDGNCEMISLCLAAGSIVFTALGVYIGILFHPIALIVLVVGNSTCILCSVLLIHSRKTFKINPTKQDHSSDSLEMSEERF